MKWFTTTPPKDGRPFLAKIQDPGYDYYYVVNYNPDFGYEDYVEFCGEQWTSWKEDQILAWTTFDELDKSFDNN